MWVIWTLERILMVVSQRNRETAMNSQTLFSDNYKLLHPAIQRWIWQQGWESLRAIEEEAIPILLNPGPDLIISAATASGKTEAAFLPILSYMLNYPDSLVLYVSPMKALINDQYSRLSNICEPLGIQVIPWHGDISASKKQNIRRNPAGIAIITPESLESLFVNRGDTIKYLFRNLKYMVIDELHSFIGLERGKQLQSLMDRVSIVIETPPVRVGLSATIGDESGAKIFLRHSNPDAVKFIAGGNFGKKLKISLSVVQSTTIEMGDMASQVIPILFEKLYSSNNIVYPDSIEMVEILSSGLADMCKTKNLPNHFYPHHGSLAKGIREEVEINIKSKASHTTVIATTTLELGIDLGSVKSVAQIDHPLSVASLKQRLGRSGREFSEPAILRAYSFELADNSRDRQLYNDIAQSTLTHIAMINLVLRSWVETPNPRLCHYSTFVQQLLSSIAQFGGLRISNLWKILVKNGAFTYIGEEDFKSILKSLRLHDFIYMVENSNEIFLTPKGENVVNSKDFYAAFSTPREYRVIHRSQVLGVSTMNPPPPQDSYMIFAGKKWRIIDIAMDKSIIYVEPAQGGKPYMGHCKGPPLDDEVRGEIRKLLFSQDEIIFLDKKAKKILASAREFAIKTDLRNKKIVNSGNENMIMTWAGDLKNETLAFLLTRRGVGAYNMGCYVEANTGCSNLLRHLRAIANLSEQDFCDVISQYYDSAVKGKGEFSHDRVLAPEKWDYLIPKKLKIKSHCEKHLDFYGLKKLLDDFLSERDENAVNSS
jgi:ATP-dependent Lhr-like helicase